MNIIGFKLTKKMPFLIYFSLTLLFFFYALSTWFSDVVTWFYQVYFTDEWQDFSRDSTSSIVSSFVGFCIVYSVFKLRYKQFRNNPLNVYILTVFLVMVSSSIVALTSLEPILVSALDILDYIFLIASLVLFCAFDQHFDSLKRKSSIKENKA